MFFALNLLPHIFSAEILFLAVPLSIYLIAD